MVYFYTNENAPEVGCAAYRPRVYKILMVRIHTVAGCVDENRGCTDLKEDHVEMHGCVNAQSVWFSRN